MSAPSDKAPLTGGSNSVRGTLSRKSDSEPTYRGESRRFLDGKLRFILAGMNLPCPGYAIWGHKLFRNGELAGLVEDVQWDRDTGAWWVTYRARIGSTMDRLDQVRRGE